MRTVIIIVIGLVIAALTLWLAPPARRVVAVGVFCVAWLLLTLWNLRTGLSHGYTLAQELPIHLVLYGVPVAAAWLGWWMLGRR